MLEAQIRNPQSETGNPAAGWECEGQIRDVERVFFLGYFEKKSLGRRLGESKTS